MPNAHTSAQSPAVATVGPSARQLLIELVKIPSVNPMGRSNLPASILFEDRSVDYLENLFKSREIAFQRKRIAPQRSNFLATYSPARAKRHLLFEAHLDTVPVDGMSIDPFGAIIRNGKLYGRGACDVKAGLASILTAFLRVCMTGSPNKVSVAFTADEEHTFLGVQDLVKINLEADFAVVAEPTNLNIVTSHKGVVRWMVSTTGRACHSSKPHEGVSAIYRMAKVLTAIEAYAKNLPNTRSGSPSLSVGVIQGGVSSNTVPDACYIEVDRRMVPGESAKAARAEFEAMIAEQRFDFEVTCDMMLACPPLGAVDPENAHLLALRKAIESVHGSHTLEAVPYGTDAAILAEAGVPCVVFGPGDIAQAHTHDEWVELAEVEKAAEILYRFAIT